LDGTEEFLKFGNYWIERGFVKEALDFLWDVGN
jgi:hypothetical protein